MVQEFKREILRVFEGISFEAVDKESKQTDYVVFVL